MCKLRALGKFHGVSVTTVPRQSNMPCQDYAQTCQQFLQACVL